MTAALTAGLAVAVVLGTWLIRGLRRDKRAIRRLREHGDADRLRAIAQERIAAENFRPNGHVEPHGVILPPRP